MGICQELTRNILSADKICEQINKFFGSLAIRQMGVDQIQEKLKSHLSSGNATRVEDWKTFLKEDIASSEFAQTSQAVVGAAMDDAKANYDDQTLPLLSMMFLADSDKDKFTTAFKAVNLVSKSKKTIDQGTNLVQDVQSKGFFGTLMGGGLNKIKDLGKNALSVGKQAGDPDKIDKADLKKLTSYHTNFVTLLPVNLLSKFNEGGGATATYVTNVLNQAFGKSAQDKFVEQTLFSKYNAQEEISVTEFFNDNYQNLKDDNGLRKGLVQNFIDNLNPTQIRNIIAGKDEKKENAQ